jgi:anti-sigma28 factor (negative regulator of flagellin synthesis)
MLVHSYTAVATTITSRRCCLFSLSKLASAYPSIKRALTTSTRTSTLLQPPISSSYSSSSQFSTINYNNKNKSKLVSEKTVDSNSNILILLSKRFKSHHSHHNSKMNTDHIETLSTATIADGKVRVDQIRIGVSWGGHINGQVFSAATPSSNPVTTILSLHGYLDNSNSFKPLATEMLSRNANFKIVALDLPGNLKSLIKRSKSSQFKFGTRLFYARRFFFVKLLFYSQKSLVRTKTNKNRHIFS